MTEHKNGVDSRYYFALVLASPTWPCVLVAPCTPFFPCVFRVPVLPYSVIGVFMCVCSLSLCPSSTGRVLRRTFWYRVFPLFVVWYVCGCCTRRATLKSKENIFKRKMKRKKISALCFAYFEHKTAWVTKEQLFFLFCFLFHTYWLASVDFPSCSLLYSGSPSPVKTADRMER